MLSEYELQKPNVEALPNSNYSGVLFLDNSFFLIPQKKESTAKLVEPPSANANMDVARDVRLKSSSGAVSDLTTRIHNFRELSEFMMFLLIGV